MPARAGREASADFGCKAEGHVLASWQSRVWWCPTLQGYTAQQVVMSRIITQGGKRLQPGALGMKCLAYMDLSSGSNERSCCLREWPCSATFAVHA